MFYASNDPAAKGLPSAFVPATSKVAAHIAMNQSGYTHLDYEDSTRWEFAVFLLVYELINSRNEEQL